MTKRSNPIILGLTGEKSGGKSTVAAYLERKGATMVRFSTTLAAILRKLHLDPEDRNNLGRLGESLRETFGTQAIARAVALTAAEMPGDLVVVDGFRKPGEVAYFRRLPRFKLLYITAPVELRFQRARRRNRRNDDRVSLERFVAVERQLASEVDIPKLGKRADFRIDNTGTEADLLAKVDAVLHTVLRR